MFLILARVFWLQVVHGKDYNLIAEGNRIRLQTIQAERGIIYDRFNRPLVANVPNASLYFIPADLPESSIDKANIINKLSQIIDKTPEELNGIWQSAPPHSYQPLLISDNLDQSQAISLAVIEDEIPGIQLTIEPRREYLEGDGLAHTLGYIGKINQKELELYKGDNYELNDYIGKDGIELYYEEVLRGTNGRQEIEVDASGKAKKILNKIDPQIGDSLVLSIDLDLQKKLTELLSQTIQKAQTGGGGVAIALDPQSGEILALVSLPSFDNNFFSAGIQQDAYQNYLTDPSQPLFDRAISGSYPPGSIFKPIVALAALEEGIIDENKTFLSTGGLQIDKWFFPDWKYGGHGRINVIQALAESVNTFFYYIGGGYNDFVGLGVDKITEYAKKFNLSKKLGIDLPGEAAGFLPDKEWKQEYKGESWYIGDTYHLAIGQGDVLVTPLQVTAYMATIANGGTLYQPHLIKKIENFSNSNKITPINQSDFIIADNFISADNIDIVRRGLRATVLSGSARSLQNLPVAVAGKTGTAQVGGDKNSHAWFSGFAPYDSPSLVLTILIENGGEGSTIAVPIFKDIVEWYFNEE
jgi:penicillin-binding protein 2